MTIKLIGPQVPMSRIETGFWSLDNALINNRGERGFTIPAFAEIYAKPGVGKTTFVTTLAGIIASKLGKNISFLDWEIQDFKTIGDILEAHGFDGTLERILEEKDEVSIDKFYKAMKDEDCAVGIMDSIAAFVSVAEQDGKQTDAVMGKRGFNMARFSRKSIRNLQLRKSPAAVLCTNHLYPTIGAMIAGTDTAGGEGKKFLATYRIALKKFFPVKTKFPNIKTNSIKFDDGWILEGKVEKNRTGFALRSFYTVMMMGEGLHTGLSALWDCVIHDLAKIDRSVKMDGEDYGTVKAITMNRDDTDLFIPFINKLRSVSKVSVPDDEDDELELVQLDDEDEV